MRNVSYCDGYCLYNVYDAIQSTLYRTILLPVDKQPEPEVAMNVKGSATTTRALEGLECKTLEEIEEPIARIDSLSRPSPDESDLDLTRQPSYLVQRVASRPQSNDSIVKEMIEEPIYVSPFCI